MTAITFDITPEDAENLQAAITGFVLPWIIAYFNHPDWSKNARRAVAISFSLLSALLASLFTSEFDTISIVKLGLKIFAASTVSYHLIAKQLGVEKWEQATAAATSIPDNPDASAEGSRGV